MTDDRTKLAYSEGIISIVLNTILFALKFWAGILSGSISVIADAWHTLSDSLTSIILIIGAKTTLKPADREHPFGHGRAELISSIIIGVLLSVVGTSFLSESVQKLFRREITLFSPLTLWVMASSAILKEALAQYAFYAYRKSGSKALKADGWHHRSDALASILIFAGIFFNDRLPWADAVLGIIVSVLIVLTALNIIKDGAFPLLGENPDNEMKKAIQKIVTEAAGSGTNMHHLHMHRYGHHTEMTFHIRLPGDKSVSEAHATATQIENRIREKLDIEATIHVEPERNTPAGDSFSAGKNS